MKRIIPVLLLICICPMILTGCSLKKVVELAGREKVEAFVNDAKTWQSGRYMLTNLDTGETDQVFSFINNADGTQSYLYEKIVDGRLFIECSDGKTFYVIDDGNTTVYNEGSEGYAAYTTENPHPYSKGELLFYVNLYASGSTESTDGNGNISYIYTYDTEKINKALGTSLSSFVTNYTFDKDGNFLYFTQTNTDGENSYAYMIEVLDVNNVPEIGVAID